MNNSCPNCGTVYNITPQLIGKSTSCKKCGASLIIDASGLQLAGGGGGAQFRAGGSDFDFRAAPRGPSGFGEFISFRKIVSPFIVKFILFYVGVAYYVYLGIRTIILSFQIGLGTTIPTGDKGWQILLWGFGYLILGPIFVRFLCELMLAVFQMNDSLKDIKKDMKK